MENRLAELILGGAVAMLWWFFREKLKGMEQRLEKTSERLSLIQTNYLDRFADLKESMTRGHEGIKDAIGELREDLAKNYMSKSDCAANIQHLHK